MPVTISTKTGSWTADERPDVRYFSGVATYTRPFELRAQPKWGRVYLDMDKIGDVAEVRVNGVLAGTAWKPPYRVDVTGQLRAGSNQLEIRVANTWQNRFVGDLQPGATKRAWTNAANGGVSMQGGAITAGTALTPSGLLAPVRLVLVE
jgi:beta-galactosidase/beta-glucuronidase